MAFFDQEDVVAPPAPAPKTGAGFFDAGDSVDPNAYKNSVEDKFDAAVKSPDFNELAEGAQHEKGSPEYEFARSVHVKRKELGIDPNDPGFLAKVGEAAKGVGKFVAGAPLAVYNLGGEVKGMAEGDQAAVDKHQTMAMVAAQNAESGLEHTLNLGRNAIGANAIARNIVKKYDQETADLEAANKTNDQGYADYAASVKAAGFTPGNGTKFPGKFKDEAEAVAAGAKKGDLILLKQPSGGLKQKRVGFDRNEVPTNPEKDATVMEDMILAPIVAGKPMEKAVARGDNGKLFDSLVDDFKRSSGLAKGQVQDTGVLAGVSKLATGENPSEHYKSPEALAAAGAPLNNFDKFSTAAMGATADPSMLVYEKAIPAIPGVGSTLRAAGRVMEWGGEALPALVKNYPLASKIGGAGTIGAGAWMVAQHAPAILNHKGEVAAVIGLGATLAALRPVGGFVRSAGEIASGMAIPETVGAIGVRSRAAFAGAVGGGAFGAALNIPDDEGDLTSSVLGGMAFGTAFGAGGSPKPAMEAAARSAMASRGASIRTGNAFEPVHDQIMAQFDQGTRDSVNRLRAHLHDGTGTDVLVVDGKSFAAGFGDGSIQAEGAQGRYTPNDPFAMGADGKTIYLNLDGIGSRGPASVGHHEAGHALIEFLKTSARAGDAMSLFKAIREGTGAENFEEFANTYKDRLAHDSGVGKDQMSDLQKAIADRSDEVAASLPPDADLTQALYADPQYRDLHRQLRETTRGRQAVDSSVDGDTMTEEVAAEITRKILDGEDVSHFALPKPTMEKVMDAASRWLEGMGVKPKASEKSDLAFQGRSVAEAARQIRDVLYEQGATAKTARQRAEDVTSGKVKATVPERFQQIGAAIREIDAMDPKEVTPEDLAQREKLVKEAQKLSDLETARKAGVVPQAQAPGVPESAPGAPPAGQSPVSGVPAAAAPAGPDRGLVDGALRSLGYDSRTSKALAASAQGSTVEDMIRNALASRQKQMAPQEPSAAPEPALANVTLGEAAPANQDPALSNLNVDTSAPMGSVPEGERPPVQNPPAPGVQDVPAPQGRPGVPETDQVDLARRNTIEGSRERQAVDVADANRGKVVWVRDYNSARKTQEGFGEQGRSEEIAEHSAAKRKRGELGDLQDKPFIPTEIRVNQAGEPYINGFDVDVMLSNLRHVTDFMAEHGIDNPLKTDKDIEAALETYNWNHNHGFDGAGLKRLEQPGPDYRMPKADQDAAPRPLDADPQRARDIADLLNMAVNSKPGEMGKEEGNKATAMSLENGGFLAGNETNGLRADLTNAGFDIDSALSSRSAFYGRLSADLIKGGMTTTPEGVAGKSVRPHGYDIDLAKAFGHGKPQFEAVSAGFMPSEDGQPERQKNGALSDFLGRMFKGAPKNEVRPALAEPEAPKEASIKSKLGPIKGLRGIDETGKISDTLTREDHSRNLTRAIESAKTHLEGVGDSVPEERRDYEATSAAIKDGAIRELDPGELQARIDSGDLGTNKGRHEHDVYLDEDSGRVLKITREAGKFGVVGPGEPGTSIVPYLERASLVNKHLDDDMRFEGVIRDGDAYKAVISQPLIKGRNATPEEIADYFKSKGYDQFSSSAFYHSGHNMTMNDAEPVNVLRGDDGGIYPIDVIPKTDISERKQAQIEMLTEGYKRQEENRLPGSLMPSEGGKVNQPLIDFQEQMKAKYGDEPGIASRMTPLEKHWQKTLSKDEPLDLRTGRPTLINSGKLTPEESAKAADAIGRVHSGYDEAFRRAANDDTDENVERLEQTIPKTTLEEIGVKVDRRGKYGFSVIEPGDSLKLAGAGGESVTFVDGDLAYKIFHPYHTELIGDTAPGGDMAVGIDGNVTQLGDGSWGMNFEAGTIGSTIKKLALIAKAGGIPSEVLGITPEGALVVKQPAYPTVLPKEPNRPVALRDSDMKSQIRHVNESALATGNIEDSGIDRVLVVDGKAYFVGDLKASNYTLDNKGDYRLADMVVGEIPEQLLKEVPHLAEQVKAMRTVENANRPITAFMPSEAPQHDGDRLEHTIPEDSLKIVHYTTRAIEGGAVDPKRMQPKAHIADDYMYRGEPKSFFFVEGSGPKEGENVTKNGATEYKAEISGARIYDMTKDPLKKWRSTDPAQADTDLIEAGYAGYKATSRDGRSFVALYEPTKVEKEDWRAAYARRMAQEEPSSGTGKLMPSEGVETMRDVLKKYTPDFDKIEPSYFRMKPVDEAQAKKQNEIARAYDALKVDNLKSPEVREAYAALTDKIQDQFKTLTDAGLKVEPWTSEGQPYKNSKELQADMKDNNHLWYFPTGEDTFGSSDNFSKDHPMLQDSGLKASDGTPMKNNDVLRAVHDAIAHGAYGVSFGPSGEEAAWRAHMATVDNPAARMALTTETRGQNSWVNFRDAMVGKDGLPLKQGDPGYVPPGERPFADQKTDLLPREYALTGDPVVDRVMQPEFKFMPSEDPRAVKEAAYKMTDGSILTGPSHAMIDIPYNGEAIAKDGFVTNDGKFLTREEAYTRALELKQMKQDEYDKLADERGFGSLMADEQLESMTFNDTRRDQGALVPVEFERGGHIVNHLRDQSTGRFAPADLASFMPSEEPKDQGALGELNLGAKFTANAFRQSAIKRRVAKLGDTFPEAIQPIYKKEDGKFILGEDGKPQAEKIDYDLDKTPLAKEAAKGKRDEARTEAVTDAYADKLVEEYNRVQDRPDIMAGQDWYELARGKIKEHFGKDALMFAQLLGATSARTPAVENFQQALDAYNNWKNGEYKGMPEKYLKLEQKLENGEELKFKKQFTTDTGARVVTYDAGTPVTGENFKHYLDSLGLLPKRTNGKKFNANSFQVLRVLAGNWAEKVGGPKTPQFASNLSGEASKGVADPFGATVDVWAARGLHMLGNDGLTDKRWRITPESETAVNDHDFTLGQQSYKKAADKLGINPDALQGVLWFAVKDAWTKRGWTRAGGSGAELSDFNTLLDKTKDQDGKKVLEKAPDPQQTLF